jgi:hypothetical protein
MHADQGIEELLQELSDAKTWAARLKASRDSGADVTGDTDEADKKIEALEKRAKEAMKRLGCVSSETRSIQQRMADMLISWYSFKDTL